MKLKSKFIVTGAILISMVAVSEWLNYEKGRISSKQEISINVVQRHMDADMKHDGVRGNIYSMLVAFKIGDQALLTSSREDVKKMLVEFANDVDENYTIRCCLRRLWPENYRYWRLRTGHSDAASIQSCI
jgi:hypothetical protein